MRDMTDEEEIELEMERQEAATDQDLFDRIADAFDRADKGAEVEAVWPVVEAELALRAEQLEATVKRVRAVAVEILGKFHQQAIVGESSRRTGWIPERQIAAWRGALDQPTDTPPRRLTEQQGGIPNDAITPDDQNRRHDQTRGDE